MAFLTVNNVTIPVEEASAAEAFISQGDLNQTIGGEFVDGKVGIRKVFSVTTPPIEYREAKALTALINGAGHTLFLNGDWGSQTGLEVLPGSFQCYFQNFLLAGLRPCLNVKQTGRLPSGGSIYESKGTFAFDVQADPSKWTVFYVFYDAVNFITHYVGCNSLGQGSYDGTTFSGVAKCTAASVSPVPFTVSVTRRGILNISPGTGIAYTGINTFYFSQLVFIPESLTQTMMNQYTTSASYVVPVNKPFCRVAGDILDWDTPSSTDAMTCLGDVESFAFTPAYLTNSDASSTEANKYFANDAVQMTFKLTQFAEAYRKEA